jgi:regulator of protease activity HflC (stomatin/prohibitin superfamily)
MAEQEKMTYNTQKEAEEVRKSLAQAKAQADTQPSVVKAERDVEIASFNAQAAVKKAEGEAGAKTRNAEADAMVLRTVGAAEGEKITAVGEAEAKVIKQKTAAMDPEKYASVEIARALAASGFKLVPEIVAGGGADGNASGIVNVLLANLVRDSMRKPT